MDSSPLSTRRLLRELKDVTSSPSEFFSAIPLEEDLFTWHCNLTSPFLGGAVWHMELKFPSTYPADPPSASLFTKFPHPNVLAPSSSSRKLYPVCTNMLESGQLADLSAKEQRIEEGTGWTAAYCIQSIMVQLQSLLLDEAALAASGVSTSALKRCKRSAKDFVCPACAHSGSAPFPPIGLTSTDVLDTYHHRDEELHSLSSGEDEDVDDGLMPDAEEESDVPRYTSPLPLLAPPAEQPHRRINLTNASTAESQHGWAAGLSTHKEDEWKTVRSRSSRQPKSNSPQSPTIAMKPSRKDDDNPFALLAHSSSSSLPMMSEKVKKDKTVVKKEKGKKKTVVSKGNDVASPGIVGSHHDGDGVSGKSSTYSHKKPTGSIFGQYVNWDFVIQEPGQATPPLVDHHHPPHLENAEMGKRRRRRRRRRRKKKKSTSVSGTADVPLYTSTTTTTTTTSGSVSSPANKDAKHGGGGVWSLEKSNVGDGWTLLDKGKERLGRSGWCKDFARLHRLAVEDRARALQVERAAEARERDAWFDPFCASLQESPLYGVPLEVVLAIMSRLPPHSLASIGLTCKSMSAAASDGFLWRDLGPYVGIHRSMRDPQSHADESSTCDGGDDVDVGHGDVDDGMGTRQVGAPRWKRLFAKEVQSIRDHLRCFYTRSTYLQDVLGVPLDFSINPKKRTVDYISSSFCLISREAFVERKLRLGMWKDSFRHWLPLYITEEHFGRALPHIQRTIAALASAGGGNRKRAMASFHPSQVLDVLPKMMNTLVVLLMDEGVGSSMHVLNGYCAVHRLFIALVDRFRLRGEINQRLCKFLKNERDRSKSSIPSIGEFICLLSATERFNWAGDRGTGVGGGAIGLALLREVLDRNVLWVCREHPEFARVSTAPTTKADFHRLKGTFEASKVSLRLTMFHVGFLHCVKGERALSQVARTYDRYFGRPPFHLQKMVMQEVREILSVDTWPAFFRRCRMKAPTPTRMTSWLVDSVKNSLRKGYHTRSTDFSRVHASGTSHILRRGESYRLASSLQAVQMRMGWGYFGGSPKFLDATCMAFAQGTYLDHVDWCHTRALDRGISHSGDCHDREQKTIHHIVNVQLRDLPKRVDALYFIISAWTGTLQDEVTLPWVKLVESKDVNAELCQYTIEKAGKVTAVLMCRMVRTSIGGWKVEALGHTCQGNASHYDPIRAAIAKLRASPPSAGKKK